MYQVDFLILCYAYVCFAATNYDIIWDQNYCNEKDRYSDSYELPHSSPCSFCFDDVITLRINSTADIYENLYRVTTETDMVNCNATNNENTQTIIFDDKQEFTIRSGGSEGALSFLLRPEPYYFISTSNGTQFSAENDLIQSPNSCLQLSFTVLFASNPNCGNYTANCNFTSVFTDNTSSLFCVTPTTTPMATTTAITTTVMNTTSMSTVSMNDTSTQSTVTTSSKGPLIISFDVSVPAPMDTVIGISFVIAIIILLIIFIPSIGIPLLILYGLGKIGCNCKNIKFRHLFEPSSPVTYATSSLDSMSRPNEYDPLYIPPQDKTANELYAPPHDIPVNDPNFPPQDKIDNLLYEPPQTGNVDNMPPQNITANDLYAPPQQQDDA